MKSGTGKEKYSTPNFFVSLTTGVCTCVHTCLSFLEDRKAQTCHGEQENKTKELTSSALPDSSTTHQQQAMQKTALVDMVTEPELLKKNCGCLPRKAGAHAHKEAAGSSQLIIYPQSRQVFKAVLAEYQMNEPGRCPLPMATAGNWPH